MILDAIFNAFATLFKPTSNAILTQLATYAKSIFEQQSGRFACFYLPRSLLQHQVFDKKSITNEVPYGFLSGWILHDFRTTLGAKILQNSVPKGLLNLHRFRHRFFSGKCSKMAFKNAAERKSL